MEYQAYSCCDPHIYGMKTWRARRGMGGTDMKKDTVYALFPSEIRRIFEQAELDVEKLQEVRMRVERPLLLQYDGREYGITGEGELTERMEGSHVVSGQELREALEYVSGYSMYAFDEEMRQGFITVPGGHRVGIAGRIVMEGDRVSCIRHISFLNIRLSHEKKGCADELMPFLLEGEELCHTLIISPPRCGKTTLLRDVIRQVSEGFGSVPGRTVGVVDERSEIGGCYLGVPQNDLGIRTDVLDCCGKAEGMMMLLRSMSPQVIAVDEIGSSADGRAIESVLHCGCKLIATVHGNSVEDIKRKPLLQGLVKSHAFERYVVLGGDRPGRIREIFDSRGTLRYRGR